MAGENNFILKLENLNLSFGGVQALTDINLDVQEKEILAIIGPNGAGKTSLLNCINGFYHPQTGKVIFQCKLVTGMPPFKIAQLGISRTFQNIQLYTGLSALDNILAGRHLFFKTGMVSGAFFFGKSRREEIAHRKAVEDIIDFLEIEAIRKQVVGALPYGLRKRVDLGRALALEPKLLLLDEPMAGMNREGKEDLARCILEIF